jgi:LmbE family N-acetylglucosaminyl deacetylase
VTLAPAGDGLRLDWPSGPWDTALVGLRVVASGPEPRVELRAGAISIVQHFDAGARGRRFLNPTSLRPALAAGTALELLPRDVTLDPSATLRRFSNRLDLRRPLLVLAPHPDDAELAAFGLYAASANATIVTITSGNAGDANYQDYFPGDVPGQYLFKGYLRAVDSVTVPWQGGVPPERCANLGYFDARLAQMHARPRDVVPEMYGPNDDVGPYRRANLGRLVPSGPRGNSWANLVADLETLLRRVRPEVVVTPHPWLDTHPDHQYVTVALAEALARWKRPATFLLYTNHAGENLYPYGPAGGVVSLPPWTGPELESSSVYAHPLGPDVRRRKLFALESMHDLRLSPSEQSSCADAGAPRRPDYPRTPAVDYFRRGPRSEELFFVFDRAGLLRLVDAFLAREAAR